MELTHNQPAAPAVELPHELSDEVSSKTLPERSQTLGALARRLLRCRDTSELLSEGAAGLGTMAGALRCVIGVIESSEVGRAPRTHEWRADGSAPGAPATSPLFDLAVSTRSPQWSQDLIPRAGGAPERGHSDAVAGGTLALPLLGSKGPLGAMTLHGERLSEWRPEVVELLRHAAGDLAAALERSLDHQVAVRSAAELRAVDRERNDLISIMSHELRAPMTVVAGIADLFERRMDRLAPETRAELIDILGRESRRLARLATQVLDVEAIDRGRIELRLRTADLNALARESVADAGLADRCEVVEASGARAEARVDADRLKQVLLNFLSNAAKFSPDAARITVGVDASVREISTRVTDRGRGIAPEDIPLLFHMFSRLDRGDGVEGSGVGLYASKAIIERHGGTIWVDSQPGRGSTFGFTLPR